MCEEVPQSSERTYFLLSSSFFFLLVFCELAPAKCCFSDYFIFFFIIPRQGSRDMFSEFVNDIYNIGLLLCIKGKDVT